MKVVLCMRCYRTSSAIAKVGNNAHTVYVTNKRCLRKMEQKMELYPRLVKQVKTVNIHTMAVKEDVSRDVPYHRERIARIVQNKFQVKSHLNLFVCLTQLWCTLTLMLLVANFANTK